MPNESLILNSNVPRGSLVMSLFFVRALRHSTVLPALLAVFVCPSPTHLVLGTDPKSYS
jgi:hypothetical protein